MLMPIGSLILILEHPYCKEEKTLPHSSQFLSMFLTIS